MFFLILYIMFMRIFQRLHLNINKYYITHKGMTFFSIVVIILYHTFQWKVNESIISRIIL